MARINLINVKQFQFSFQQANIDATNMTMRQYLPPDILAFTVTKPMFENLCKLNKNSFLEKGFIKHIKESKKIKDHLNY